MQPSDLIPAAWEEAAPPPANGSSWKLSRAWWSLWVMLWLALLGSFAAQEQATKTLEPPPAETAGDATFQVIAHGANPSREISAAQVARIFLKKLKRWDDGDPALPVDLGSKSPIREAFTRSVHNKSVFAIKMYWQRMIFSGRGDLPPEELPSEAAALDFVREHPGAIGYVAAETPLGEGVKQLIVRP